MNPDGTPPNHPPSQFPWHALEAMAGLELTSRPAALPIDWQNITDGRFEALRATCLQPAAWHAKHYTCPRNCGCNHTILRRHDGTGATAACHCKVPNCPDINLTIEDITPLELSWPRLVKALAATFGLAPKLLHHGPSNTVQFGALLPKGTLPAIITIHSFYHLFRASVAELVATQDQPFLLFAPTARHFDAQCQIMLDNVDAQFFPLETTALLTPKGDLVPARPPAELFARFLAPPATRQLSTLNSQPSTPSGEAARSTLHALTLHDSAPRPKYMLKRELGVWHLIFDGQEAFLKHERGLFYVAYLLYHPGEVIHAIDLMAKIPEIYRNQLGLAPLIDPTTGKPVTLESHARLQERSLALDDAESMRALYKKEKQLEAILDSDDATEPEKAEALRELEQIADFQRRHASKSKDAAQAAARSVRAAIKRVLHHLLRPQSPDQPGKGQAFAQHLADYLLNHPPRPRHPSQNGPSPAGSFMYTPPAAVHWSP